MRHRFVSLVMAFGRMRPFVTPAFRFRVLLSQQRPSASRSEPLGGSVAVIGSRNDRGMRYVRTVAVALAALAVPTVALADSTTPVDVQIDTRQPEKVGLGETFVVGTTVGVNPAGPMDPGRFPDSWSLTWAATFPAGLSMVSGGWAGLGTPKLPNCVANCVYVMNIPADRGYEYRVKATSMGAKILNARITETSNPDPLIANNTAEAVVRVVPLRITLRPEPAQPRTGRRLLWQLAATSAISGLAIQPTKKSCSAQLGTRHLIGNATATNNKINCALQIPAGSAGKQLTATATASFAAANTTVSRTFVIQG